MKKYTFLFLIALCAIIMSCLSSDFRPQIYVSPTMEISSTDLCSAVAELRAATTPEQIEAAAATLEAVREQDSDNWLAHYHTAYAYGRVAHITEEMNKIDGWVEKAERAVKSAAKTEGADASEISVLKSYLTYAKIRVNPMMRGYKHSKTAMDFLGQAVKENGNNPRSYLLITQHLINVPAVLGGDPDKACKYIQAALKTYGREAAQEERDPLLPSWGLADSEDLAKEYCEESETSKRK